LVQKHWKYLKMVMPTIPTIGFG